MDTEERSREEILENLVECAAEDWSIDGWSWVELCRV